MPDLPGNTEKRHMTADMLVTLFWFVAGFYFGRLAYNALNK